MIIFPHDPTNLYFGQSLIRIPRWVFDFAIRTPKKEKCFCTAEGNRDLRIQAFSHDMEVIGRKLEELNQ